MSDMIMIVDQYQRQIEAARRGLKLDPEREAQGLSLLARPLGRICRRIAIVAQNDEAGAQAYQKAGFETLSMYGTRPAELQQFIVQVDKELDAAAPPHIVLVSADPEFGPLVRSAQRKAAHFSVWAPRATVPPEFVAASDYRPLEELLPETEIKLARVDVRLDYENLHIGLKHRKMNVSPQALIDAIRASVASLGEVVSIVAYADWGLLAWAAGLDIQRELAQLRVEPRYQINLYGKNSADMKIADDIRTLVEKDATAPDRVDVIALGTGDRDFRCMVETAKARGKKVVILALRGGVSHELEAVAGEVRYLDDYLPSRPERFHKHVGCSPQELPRNSSPSVLQQKLRLRPSAAAA